MSEIPRMRVIAGPNGSGKSTLKDDLPQHLLGLYVNADDIERSPRQARCVDLSSMGVSATRPDFEAYLERLRGDASHLRPVATATASFHRLP